MDPADRVTIEDPARRSASRQRQRGSREAARARLGCTLSRTRSFHPRQAAGLAPALVGSTATSWAPAGAQPLGIAPCCRASRSPSRPRRVSHARPRWRTTATVRVRRPPSRWLRMRLPAGTCSRHPVRSRRLHLRHLSQPRALMAEETQALPSERCERQTAHHATQAHPQEKRGGRSYPARMTGR